MSFESLERIATGLNSRIFVVERDVLPFNRTPLIDAAKLEAGSVHAVISGERLKIMFRLASGSCANKNTANPWIHIDPAEPLPSISDLLLQKPKDRQERHLMIGQVLVASVKESLKPFIFSDINIAKSIEDISARYKGGSDITFSTLRLPSDATNQLRYQVAAYARNRRPLNYSLLNVFSFSIERTPHEIKVEMGREKAETDDTIAIKAIMGKVLWLLGESKYIERFDPANYSIPGTWTFENYRD